MQKLVYEIENVNLRSQIVYFCEGDSYRIYITITSMLYIQKSVGAKIERKVVSLRESEIEVREVKKFVSLRQEEKGVVLLLLGLGQPLRLSVSLEGCYLIQVDEIGQVFPAQRQILEIFEYSRSQVGVVCLSQVVALAIDDVLQYNPKSRVSSIKQQLVLGDFSQKVTRVVCLQSPFLVLEFSGVLSLFNLETRRMLYQVDSVSAYGSRQKRVRSVLLIGEQVSLVEILLSGTGNLALVKIDFPTRP